MKVSFENYSIQVYKLPITKKTGNKYLHGDFKATDSISFNGYAKPVTNSADNNAKLITSALNNMMAIVKLNKQQEQIMQSVNFPGRYHAKGRFHSSLLGKNKYAGMVFEREKSKLDLITDNMVKAAADETVKIPPSILFSGNSYSAGKALNGFFNRTCGLYNLIELTPSDFKDGVKGVKETVAAILEKNRADYFKTGKRSLIYIEQAERYFGIDERSAEILGIDLSSDDRDLLRTINTNTNISYFKSLFDNVSKLPEKDDFCNQGYATTFILISENPHLIDPDLITREGKMTNIFYDIPNGQNLKNLILYSVYEHDSRFQDVFSDEDWLKILKEINPNKRKGGLSEKKINKIISDYYMSIGKEKTNDSLKDELNIIKNLLEAERDIEPKECNKFYILAKNFGYRIMEEDEESLEDLLFQRELDLLTPKTTALLKEKLNDLEKELGILKAKQMCGELGKKGLKRMNEIEKILYGKDIKGADNEGTI